MARMSGIVRGAGGGMSRLAAALGGGGNVEQQAFDQTMAGQSKIALAMAQMRAQEAGAAKDYAAADETAAKTAALQQRPQTFQRLIAANSGTDVPNVSAFLKQLDTGTAGQVPMGPEAPDGGMGVGTAQFDPATASRITQQLQRFAPLATNTGDFKADDWAQALASFRNSDLGDQVLNGQRTAGQVGASQAAVAGKPLFNADSTGAVLDLFGGKLATDNPMAGSTINLRREQAGAQKANAVQSYAAADNSRASAAATRAAAADGTSRTGGKAPAGYRWGADGQTLEAIPGGPADKTHAASEGERKAGALLMRLRGSQQQLLNVLGETPASDKPIAAAELVKKIPLVGEMAANGMTPEARQRVEAAQLDMLDAALTLGTGAAYTKEQLVGYAKSYFPAVNDDKKTREDKRIRLANIIRAAEIAAGRSAADAIPVVPAPGAPRTPAPAAPAGRNVTVDW